MRCVSSSLCIGEMLNILMPFKMWSDQNDVILQPYMIYFYFIHAFDQIDNHCPFAIHRFSQNHKIYMNMIFVKNLSLGDQKQLCLIFFNGQTRYISMSHHTPKEQRFIECCPKNTYVSHNSFHFMSMSNVLL